MSRCGDSSGSNDRSRFFGSISGRTDAQPCCSSSSPCPLLNRISLVPEQKYAVMPKNTKVRVTIPAVVDGVVRRINTRLSRMEDLLLEMRAEQDVKLKKIEKLQQQVEELMATQQPKRLWRETSGLRSSDRSGRPGRLPGVPCLCADVSAGARLAIGSRRGLLRVVSSRETNRHQGLCFLRMSLVAPRNPLNIPSLYESRPCRTPVPASVAVTS